MPLSPLRRKRFSVRHRRRNAATRFERLEDYRLLTAGPYTFSLVDGTSLDSARYAVQVLGYSAASALTLQPSSSPGELAWSAPADSATQYGTVDGTAITGLHEPKGTDAFPFRQRKIIRDGRFLITLPARFC